MSFIKTNQLANHYRAAEIIVQLQKATTASRHFIFYPKVKSRTMTIMLQSNLECVVLQQFICQSSALAPHSGFIGVNEGATFLSTQGVVV